MKMFLIRETSASTPNDVLTFKPDVVIIEGGSGNAEDIRATLRVINEFGIRTFSMNLVDFGTLYGLYYRNEAYQNSMSIINPPVLTAANYTTLLSFADELSIREDILQEVIEIMTDSVFLGLFGRKHLSFKTPSFNKANLQEIPSFITLLTQILK